MSTGNGTGGRLAERGIVFTFYSYKGGVGRSMALANAAALLAKWGRKVLIIDWDLEAPGLEKYFLNEPSRVMGSRAQTPGVVDLVRAFDKGEALDWRSCLLQIFPFGPDDSVPISILSAGRESPDYVKNVQEIDWEVLFNEKGLGNYLEEVREEWVEEFDFVLIDSRTGITDIGGICTIHLPDVLVLLFTANNQSLQGVIDVMQRARDRHKSLPYDRNYLLGIPVPTRFENVTEYKLAGEWKKRFASELTEIYKEWIPTDKTPADILEKLFIPYFPFWSFGENLPVAQEGTTDPRSLGFAYELLAKLINSRLQWDQALKGEVTLSSERTPAQISEEAERVYAALNAEDQRLARSVFTRLVRLAAPGEGEDSRKRTRLSHLEAEERRVAALLIDARLLVKVLSEASGEEKIEIANDGLLRHWERLKEWVNQDRDFLLWRQNLGTSIAEWENLDKDSGALLSGAPLNLAQTWLNARGEDLNDREKSYVTTSASRVDARQRRKQLIYAAIAAAVVMGAIAIGLFINWRNQRALEEERARTEAIRLTAIGEDKLDNGEYAAAIGTLNEAIAVKDDYSPAYFWRAVAYTQECNREKATADFNKAIELNNDPGIKLEAERKLKDLSAPLPCEEPQDTPPVEESPQTLGTPSAQLPPRIYDHIADTTHMTGALAVQDELKKKGFVFPGKPILKPGPNVTQVRYFRKAEEDEAEQIAEVLRIYGRAELVYIPGHEDSVKMRPRHFEIWYGRSGPPLGGAAR